MELPLIPDHINTLAKNIQLLVLDVDGILSDGRLYFSNSGEESKAFYTQDGLGLKLLQSSGVRVAIITGRESAIVERRAANLGIDLVFQGSDDKKNILDDMLSSLGMDYSSVAYAGDDLPDLACIKAAQLGITVPDGHSLVQQNADAITTRDGGSGAVREICDWILIAQNNYESAVAPYL